MLELESKLDSVDFGRPNQPKEKNSGRYADPMKVLDGRTKSHISNPNYDPKDKDSPRLIEDVRHPAEMREVQKSAYRKAKNVNKWGGRAARTVKDASDSLQGKPRGKDRAGREKKKEWEKAYFKQGAAALATTGGILAAGEYGRRHPEKRDAVYDWVDEKTEKLIKKPARKFLRGSAEVAAKGAKHLSSEDETIELRPAMCIDFNDPTRGYMYDENGRKVFKYSDVRGRSGRISHGDKPFRERRKKREWEKVENERKLWAAGGLLATTGGLLVGRKIGRRGMKKRNPAPASSGANPPPPTKGTTQSLPKPDLKPPETGPPPKQTIRTQADGDDDLILSRKAPKEKKRNPYGVDKDGKKYK